MQTEQQVIEKIDDMTPDLIEAIKKQAVRLYHSGGVDPEKYENNYRLPKILMAVILSEQGNQYTPPYPGADTRTIKNLRRF